MAELGQELTQAKVDEMFKAAVGDTLKQFKQLLEDARQANRLELDDLLKQQVQSAKDLADPKRLARINHACRMLRMHSLAGGDPDGAIKQAEKLGDKALLKSLEENRERVKTLGSTTIGGGGALIAPEFSTDLVEFLRAPTVVMESGARTIDMPAGEAFFGRVSSGAVATWRGESQAATYSEPGLEQVQPRAHILDVIAAMSNQFIRRASVSADEFLRTELQKAVKLKMDQTFLRSVGTVYQPRGITSWVESGNKFNATNVAGTADGSTTAEIVANLGQCIRLLKDDNIAFTRPGWIFSNRTYKKLLTMRDSGFWVFRDELTSGSLFGIPWKSSGSVPDNLGGTSDYSEVVLADFFELVVYMTMGISVRESKEAAYTVGGSLVSSFERDESLVACSMECDFIDRRNGKSEVLIEQVRWGAP